MFFVCFILLIICPLVSSYFEDFHFENLPHERVSLHFKCKAVSCAKIAINFSAYGQRFNLVLKENREILAHDFQVIVDADEKENLESETRFKEDISFAKSKCKYFFSDDKSVSATVSICNFNETSGLISQKGFTFLLRYDPAVSDDADSWKQHSLFRYEDVPCPTGRCLDSDPIQKVQTYLRERSMTIMPRFRSTDPQVTRKYLELALVYDYQTLALIELTSSKSIMDFTLKLVHVMSSNYFRLDITVVLQKLILWPQKDRITHYNDIEDSMLSFGDYILDHYDSQEPQDATLLISGHRFINSPGVLGIGTKGKTCENCELAVAVISYGEAFDVTHVAGIASHELGHNLGFDDEFYTKDTHQCYQKCKDPQDEFSCIMRGVYTSGSTVWSECTKERVINRETSNSYECLYNAPNGTVAASICANGIIEEGEECDCRADDMECLKCCNITICKLTPGSNCSSELCCKNCDIVSKGTVCRSIRDDVCDFEDVCNGVDKRCFDSHRMDRTECGNGKWCLSGICEYKCHNNCYGRGNCISNEAHELICNCKGLSWGRFCSQWISFSDFVLLLLICFLISFLTALPLIWLCRMFCCKRRTK